MVLSPKNKDSIQAFSWSWSTSVRLFKKGRESTTVDQNETELWLYHLNLIYPCLSWMFVESVWLRYFFQKYLKLQLSFQSICRWIQGTIHIWRTHCQWALTAFKTKHKFKRCRAWKFQFILYTNLSGWEKVSRQYRWTYEKMNLLSSANHPNWTGSWQTGLGHMTRVVISITALCNFILEGDHRVRTKQAQGSEPVWDQQAPWQAGRQSSAALQTTHFFAVQEQCREHSRALVKSFLQAGIGQRRMPVRCLRAKKIARYSAKLWRKPFHPLPRPAVWLNILMHVGQAAWAERPSSLRTTQSSEKTSSELCVGRRCRRRHAGGALPAAAAPCAIAIRGPMPVPQRVCFILASAVARRHRFFAQAFAAIFSSVILCHHCYRTAMNIRIYLRWSRAGNWQLPPALHETKASLGRLNRSLPPTRIPR